MAPSDTQFVTLARDDEDIVHALAWLADELGAAQQPIAPAKYDPPRLATGAINAATLAQSLGGLIPENAIVVDEGVSTGRGFFPSTRNAHPHTWLQNMGGSIGIGMPLATGAAVACPDRPVLNLEADGSAMYTLQALWTQAREGLDVTTVILANRAYAILDMELSRVGAAGEGGVGPAAAAMLDISRPELDFVALAGGMGVPATRVETADALVAALGKAFAEPGPHVVEAMLPRSL